MLEPGLVVATVLGYLALLFAVALYVERRAAAGKELANRAVVYGLSLAVYCTAWTYFGSVGYTTHTGLLGLAIYLGPSLCAVFWWSVLRKLVRIKSTQRVTSIADLISARYGNSQVLAALVSAFSVVAIVPYVALQLKAVLATMNLIMGRPATAQGGGIAFIIVVTMALFTILFGIRKLTPTERHPGMVMALAVESVVKLVASLAVGVFVLYFLGFQGPRDLFEQFEASQWASLTLGADSEVRGPVAWLTHLLLAASAILMLPRQFHVAVVENHREEHIRTAMWLLPLYLLLINLFVFPLAAAGLLLGLSPADADLFVLLLPLNAGAHALALFVFLGGFSAATGMIVVESMTAATMISNHLVLPLAGALRSLGFLRRRLLQVRWAAAVLLILAGYGYTRVAVAGMDLVSIGLISFAAFLQLLPLTLGGLYWRQGNRAGALAGLTLGMTLWAYCLVLPIFARGGWVSPSLLSDGPFGMRALRPEALLGVERLDPLSHAVMWSLTFNVVGYLVGSLWVRVSQTEALQVERFVGILEVPAPLLSRRLPALIDCEAKRVEVKELFARYYDQEQAEALATRCLTAAGIDCTARLSVVDLAELQNEVEHTLAGAIGAAAAHAAVRQSNLMSVKETEELARVYADMLAELRLPPADLYRRIEFHRERERLLTAQAEQLSGKVRERDRALAIRDEFIAIAAHELRTPITPLKLRLQALMLLLRRHEREAPWAEQAQQGLAACERQLSRLTRLVDNLLDASQRESTQLKLSLEELDLAELVTEVAEAFPECQLALDLERPLPGRWDRLHLERLLSNLIANAAKFGRGMPIDIRLRRVDTMARLAVRDRGIGIPPEDQARIFDRFEQAVSSFQYGGLGLGLYIARQVAEAHGGTIRVRSVRGEGSTFIVELPGAIPRERGRATEVHPGGP
ncbi:MAG: sensor histidine kinase [Myxococcota bacterium]